MPCILYGVDHWPCCGKPALAGSTHFMKLLRLLLGTHLSKKHFMLEDANTLLLAHNCRAIAAAKASSKAVQHM
jgi:hypothetical protein